MNLVLNKLRISIMCGESQVAKKESGVALVRASIFMSKGLGPRV